MHSLSYPPTAPSPRDPPLNASDEGRVPRGREPDGLRKNRCTGDFAESVQGFLEWDDRDAEPRLLDEILLDRVDSFGVLLRGELLAGPRPDLKPEDAAAVVVRRVVEIAGDHEQLPEFFFERHAADE